MLRVKIRCMWLAFLRDVKVWFTKCAQCGTYGAYACSLCAGKKLCTECQLLENAKFDGRLRAHGLI